MGIYLDSGFPRRFLFAARRGNPPRLWKALRSAALGLGGGRLRRFSAPPDPRNDRGQRADAHQDANGDRSRQRFPAAILVCSAKGSSARLWERARSAALDLGDGRLRRFFAAPDPRNDRGQRADAYRDANEDRSRQRFPAAILVYGAKGNSALLGRAPLSGPRYLGGGRLRRFSAAPDPRNDRGQRADAHRDANGNLSRQRFPAAILVCARRESPRAFGTCPAQRPSISAAVGCGGAFLPRPIREMTAASVRMSTVTSRISVHSALISGVTPVLIWE